MFQLPSTSGSTSSPVGFNPATSQCDICVRAYDATRRPKLLHCGHVFCSTCVPGMKMFSNDLKVLCATCCITSDVARIVDVQTLRAIRESPRLWCMVCMQYANDECATFVHHGRFLFLPERAHIYVERMRESALEELQAIERRMRLDICPVAAGPAEDITRSAGLVSFLKFVLEFRRAQMALGEIQWTVSAGVRTDLFYLQFAIDGAPCGRVVVRVFTSEAPRMARNFATLIAGTSGYGYRGCRVVQAWARESLILGDVERNTGSGGRSALSTRHFPPERTALPSTRGWVGMRRAPDSGPACARGRVGSQFRMLLWDEGAFSAVFARVEAGLPLLDALARTGDGAGYPRCEIVVADCGPLPQ